MFGKNNDFIVNYIFIFGKKKKKLNFNCKKMNDLLFFFFFFFFFFF